MSQQQAEPAVSFFTQRSGIPIPVAPRKKAAILITIILLDLLSITFAALCIPFYTRHDSYGRRGAWERPWNSRGPAANAILWVSLSLFLANTSLSDTII